MYVPLTVYTVQYDVCTLYSVHCTVWCMKTTFQQSYVVIVAIKNTVFRITWNSAINWNVSMCTAQLLYFMFIKLIFFLLSWTVVFLCCSFMCLTEYYKLTLEKIYTELTCRHSLRKVYAELTCRQSLRKVYAELFKFSSTLSALIL